MHMIKHSLIFRLIFSLHFVCMFSVSNGLVETLGDASGASSSVLLDDSPCYPLSGNGPLCYPSSSGGFLFCPRIPLLFSALSGAEASRSPLCSVTFYPLGRSPL